MVLLECCTLSYLTLPDLFAVILVLALLAWFLSMTSGRGGPFSP